MIFFTDIDDTIMKTKRKITSSLENLTIGAFSKSGEPLSYIDEKRKHFIDKILQLNNNIVIPVTARNITSFNNLNISFKHHSIINFGAIILNPDKSENIDWKNIVLGNSKNLNQSDIFIDIQKYLSIHMPNYFNDFEFKIPLDNNISYLNIRYMNTLILDNIRSLIENYLVQKNHLNDFYFYQTDRDLAIIPNFIKKELAVDFTLSNLYTNNDITIGVGDNINDFEFMSRCDFSIIPNDSSLNKLIRSI